MYSKYFVYPPQTALPMNMYKYCLAQQQQLYEFRFSQDEMQLLSHDHMNIFCKYSYELHAR